MTCLNSRGQNNHEEVADSLQDKEKNKQSMKWILFFFFETKKLFFHLTDDFHVMNVPTTPTVKANAVFCLHYK